MVTHAAKYEPGLYGRKPPEPKNFAKAMRFSDILKDELPDIPVSEDYGSLFSSQLQMLGNDQYGDCVPVTLANERGLITTALTGKTSYMDLDQVLQFYKTQNKNFPTDDNGMVIQLALEYLLANGGPDGVKPLAFAKVDYTNAAELSAALAIFGQVWIGANVQSSNETQFAQGKTWTYTASAKFAGGHSVVAVGYDGTKWKFFTWAKETDFDEKFRTHSVEEAWVVIWPENVGQKQFLAGIDMAKLASAYTAVTHGKPFPVITPPVPDTPPPVNPTPDPNVPVVANAADKTLASKIPVGWTMRKHEGDVKKVALALAEWSNEVGVSLSGPATDVDQS